MTIQTEIQFANLPLWKNVRDRPGDFEAYPLFLGQDPRGFIRQTTGPEVYKRVIAAYGADDYAYITNPPGTSDWANFLGARQIEFVKSHMQGLDGAAILDIGGGSAYLAAMVQDLLKDIDYTIIDPSIRAEAPQGVTAIRDYFPCKEIEGRKFDAIISFNCLEHVEDPAVFLEGIRHFLAGDGIVLLSFPNTLRQLSNGDFCALTHEHISYMTDESAAAVLKAAGLKPTFMETRNDTLWIKAVPSEPATEKTPMNNLLATAALGFTNNLISRKKDINAALTQGQTVAFHGANIGLNNFCYLADIMDRDGIMVFDGDDAKVGRFLPTLKTPIRHATDVAYKKAAKIYVAATSFYDDIIDFLVQRHGLPPSRIEPLCPL